MGSKDGTCQSLYLKTWGPSRMWTRGQTKRMTVVLHALVSLFFALEPVSFSLIFIFSIGKQRKKLEAKKSSDDHLRKWPQRDLRITTPSNGTAREGRRDGWKTWRLRGVDVCSCSDALLATQLVRDRCGWRCTEVRRTLPGVVVWWVSCCTIFNWVSPYLQGT